MSVRMETIGPVLVVTIDRPEVRNAVDAPTANALVDVFRAFDTDSRALAAVLTGADGTFCAGADLKAISQGTGNRVDAPPANGPLGVTRMVLGKPVIAAVEGFAVAGAGAHPLVRSARRRLECRLRRVLPALGSAAGRRGHHPAPSFDRPQSRPRHDPHRPGRHRRRGLAQGLANRLTPPGDALTEAVELGEQLAAFPQRTA
jgi:enoyl-CoA hydratase